MFSGKKLTYQRIVCAAVGTGCLRDGIKSRIGFFQKVKKRLFTGCIQYVIGLHCYCKSIGTDENHSMRR